MPLQCANIKFEELMSHTSIQELSERLNYAKLQVEVGGTYQHFRDSSKHYKVLAIALNESNEEPVVVYQSLYMPYVIWTRPVTLWTERVDNEGKLVPRFQKV